MDIANVALPIAHLSRRSLTEAIARAHEQGIRAITFGGIPTRRTPDMPSLDFLWDDLDDAARAEVIATRGAFDRAVLHAPFQDLPLVSVNPYVEREALRQVRSAVRAAGALNVEVVTVHAVPRHQRIPPDEFMTRLVNVMRALGDEAARVGTRIGLENWRYPADPDEHVDLLDAIDHPAVGATLDVGHIAYWFQRDGVTSLADDAAITLYNQRLVTLIDRLGKRIIHVHAHDARASDLRDHLPVGQGIIDFDAVMERLLQLSFEGLFLLELQVPEPDYEQAAIESRARLGQAMTKAANAMRATL